MIDYQSDNEDAHIILNECIRTLHKRLEQVEKMVSDLTDLSTHLYQEIEVLKSGENVL